MLTADSDRIDEDLDVAAESPQAATQEAAQEPDTNSGNVCSNCQQPLAEEKVTVCPHCGYYFSLGICIELDQAWERLAGGQTAEPAEAKKQPQSKSTLDELRKLVPSWAWGLIGCNVAVLLVSIFVRIAVPSGFLQTLWCLTQLFAGLAAFMACHAIAYLISISDDASMNVLDIVLKPFKVWKDAVRELPERFYLVAVGSCSVTAVVGSLLIIGALNYKVLLD